MGDRKAPTPPPAALIFPNRAVESLDLRAACLPIGPALVRLSDWIKTPCETQGCVNNVWAPYWGIITNAAMPIPKFQSTEKWIAVAFDSAGTARLILPGCKVFALMPSHRPDRPSAHDEWFLS